MLVAGTYTAIQSRGQESTRESLLLFTQWTPPAGFTFLSHVSRVDGKGGLFLAEADSNLAILEATAPFSAYFDFDIWPVVDIQEAVPAFMRVNDWVDDILYEDEDEDEDDEE